MIFMQPTLRRGPLIGLVSKIVLTPQGWQARDRCPRGPRRGILAFAHARATSAADGIGLRAKRKAGNHGQHSLPKLIGRPRGAAYVAVIAQQVKLVAGVGFEPTTFRL